MNLKTKLATIATASMFALSLGTAAMAQTSTGSVTQKVLAGNPTYSISGATLSTVQYADTVTYGDGDLTLDFNGHGNLNGWTLSVQATKDFEYGGTSAARQDIPASNLLLVSADAPVYVEGQEIDTVNGPIASTASEVSLGESVAVSSSNTNYGSGSYTQNLNVKLEVPAYSQVGTYTGEVTVSTSAAPGGTN